jgi:DNA adenine methylase
LASKIVALMPPHLHYVEPYAGGLAVLLAKDPESVSEVANDLNGDLTTFWQVLQDEGLFASLVRRLEATPFSEFEFKLHRRALSELSEELSPVARAAAFFVVCRQGLAGRGREFTPLTRTRTRRNMNAEASAWLNAIEGLVAVHERMKRIVVLNRPALEVIQSQDGPDTLFYCDPPYLHQTRTAKKVYGRFEMKTAEHRQLLDVLLGCKGKVMLSGYPSKLYDEVLAGWARHTFDLRNNAAAGRKKNRETEVLWCNF